MRYRQLIIEHELLRSIVEFDQKLKRQGLERKEKLHYRGKFTYKTCILKKWK